MKNATWDRVALAVFFIFGVLYLIIAWYASIDVIKHAFDSIHGYRIFDIDDAYRRYLATSPFLTAGLWVWNFYLPGNIIVDGFFSWVSHHNEFWMRVPHLLLNLFSLWLIYRSGRYLNIHAGWMLLACCTLLWMPLNALLSMSFYAESLLTVALGISIYALASQKKRLLGVSAATMPFFRPEGALYLGFLTLERLWQKRWREAIGMMWPAFIYFLIFMTVFHFSPIQYWLDRSAFTSMYAAANPGGRAAENLLPYFTINPIWWLLGLCGSLLPSMKRYRPFLIGALALMSYLWITMSGGYANGEARYFYSVLPLFTLYIAALLQTLSSVWNTHKKAVTRSLVALILLVGMENLLQLDPLRNQWFDGNRYPVGQTLKGPTEFRPLPEVYSLVLKQAYAFVCAYSDYDPTIDKVLVNTIQWFNKSNVCPLSDKVRVELSFVKAKMVYQYLDGYFFSMFPALPHYAFYQFSPAPNDRTLTGEHYALYVTAQDDVFPGKDIQPLFTNQVFNIYKVRYHSEQYTPFFPAHRWSAFLSGETQASGAK